MITERYAYFNFNKVKATLYTAVNPEKCAPTLVTLPRNLLVSTTNHYIFSKIAQSSTSLWMTVAIISSLAENLLFIGIIQFKNYFPNRKWTFISIHALFSPIEIEALQHFQLISIKGAILLYTYAIIRLTIFSRFENKNF